MGFLRYFYSHTPSDYYCHVQVVSQGQNRNWHLPPAGISVHAYLWKAGCRAPEPVVTSDFPLQVLAEFRHHKPHCTCSVRDHEGQQVSSLCASLRSPLRCCFVSEFRSSITEHIIVLCMLHWEGGICYSSSLKLQPF